ncbi:hypothetical protein BKA64DRAFT_647818 [Cadophora sp. MPI-SDFR-AT-0126]|nr:hypothetical protein BKA64DRAFT_647818 [Leotiomycetes sp. MPI-SDFR-AT-0126]
MAARLPMPVLGPGDHEFLDRSKLILNSNPEKPGTSKLPDKSGYFAKIDIPEGTLIFIDWSTFTATTFIKNPDLQNVLECALWSMPQCKEDHSKKNACPKTSMFSDYAIPIYSLRSERWNGPDFEKIGFFRWMAYFRHNYLPNAYFSYDYINRYGAIHAIRKISNGEEVTISYLPESAYDIHTLPDALDILKNTFGPTC